MRIYLISIFVCFAFAGCATAPAEDSCTNLISGVGGLLKFCQTANKVDATESGMLGHVETGDLRIVDDPETLASLSRHIGLRPDFAKSRRLVAHACIVKDQTYASIRVSDLRRIMSRIHSKVAPDTL